MLAADRSLSARCVVGLIMRDVGELEEDVPVLLLVLVQILDVMQ